MRARNIDQSEDLVDASGNPKEGRAWFDGSGVGFSAIVGVRWDAAPGWAVGATYQRGARGGLAAIRDWSVHRGAGLAVESDGPLCAGTNVVLDAPLPVGFVTATCRVVVVVDEPDRFGFAYGTLQAHPERGEESFVIGLDDNGRVRFRVDAVSRPAYPLARAAPPVADRLQEVGADGHPAAGRLAGQLHPVAAVDPLLAVQRQVVGVLADGHLGHQPRPGQPLLDRLGEPLGDDDVPLATLAGVHDPYAIA